MTDGCLAVNVIRNHDITCELTTGLSEVNEMQEDSLSELCVAAANSLTRNDHVPKAVTGRAR